MSRWTPGELQRIASSDDFHIAPFRPDGVTPGTPTWIWSVVVGDGVYVRAWNGTSSRWFGAARDQHAGRITAGGMDRAVAFVLVDDAALGDGIDEAYRAKYAGSPYLSPMLTARVRAATVRVDPRPTDDGPRPASR